MAIYAIHTVSGTPVALIRAQDDAPPPAVAGDLGYVMTTVDLDDDAVDMSGVEAESEIRRAFEGLGAPRA